MKKTYSLFRLVDGRPDLKELQDFGQISLLEAVVKAQKYADADPNPGEFVVIQVEHIERRSPQYVVTSETKPDEVA